jgi:CDP-paratose 2-epimerase
MPCRFLPEIAEWFRISSTTRLYENNTYYWFEWSHWLGIGKAFHELGWRVHGIDNNMRAEFFGPQGDTRWNQQRLLAACPGFSHHEQDVRDRAGITGWVKRLEPDAVVHAAAQPSHDLAASRPFDDFDVNAGGTLNLLD